MKKLLALSALLLIVPTVSSAVEITITPKQAALVSGVAAAGALVAHVVSKQYYEKDDPYDTTNFLPTEEDEKHIQISQWAKNIRNMLALLCAAAGGYALAAPTETKQTAAGWPCVISFFRK